MKRIVVALAFAAAAEPSLAADMDGAYWSQRPPTCREFLKVYRSDEHNPESDRARNWIAGYITAYNRQTPGTYNIMGLSEFEQVLQSVERYCRDNRPSDVGAAMESVTADLFATRHQTRRQAGR